MRTLESKCAATVLQPRAENAPSEPGATFFYAQKTLPLEAVRENLAERRIEALVGEREVMGWCALLCLLISTRIFDFLQSSDSTGDPTPSNQPKLVASRVKRDSTIGSSSHPPPRRSHTTSSRWNLSSSPATYAQCTCNRSWRSNRSPSILHFNARRYRLNSSPEPSQLGKPERKTAPNLALSAWLPPGRAKP
jgi:hypothetical protein